MVFDADYVKLIIFLFESIEWSNWIIIVFIKNKQRSSPNTHTHNSWRHKNNSCLGFCCCCREKKITLFHFDWNEIQSISLNNKNRRNEKPARSPSWWTCLLNFSWWWRSVGWLVGWSIAKEEEYLFSLKWWSVVVNNHWSSSSGSRKWMNRRRY